MMHTLSADSFLKMKKLRFLKILYLPNSPDLVQLSNELRLLEWHGYPLKSLPPSFQPEDIVALFLPCSCLEHLWKGNRLFQQLKLVNLNDSQYLRKTPDFTMTPNLESLSLEGCTKLVDVHPSLAFLERLKLLNLKGCKSLRNLPPKIGMKSLEKLILSGCSNLRRFPEIDGEMEHLVELYLDGTPIEQLPTSIGHLSSLVLLNLEDCRNLANLPSSIHGLKCLKKLNLSGCSKVENLPEELQDLEFLEMLDLSGTAIRKPQSFIFQFKNLKVLSFKGCKGSTSKVVSYWNPLSRVLQRGSTNSMALTLPPLSGLTCLTELDLSDCNIGEGAIPSDISCLSSLEFLDLSGNNFFNVPATLVQLSNLLLLRLSNCKELKSLPGLLTSTAHLSIDGCSSLAMAANPTTVCNSMKQAFINATNCYRFAENNNPFTLLIKHLKVGLVYGNTRPYFNVIMPGSEIPKSFNIHGGEASKKIALPHNIWNDSQWMGVALCCVLASASGNDAWGNHEGLVIRPHIHGHGKGPRFVIGYIFESDYSLYRIIKDHIWLVYWSRDKLYPSPPLEEKCGEIENNSSSSMDLANHEIEFRFTPHRIGGVRINVKKYGVRLVYERDLEEMEETTEQQHSPTSPNLKDIDFCQDSTSSEPSSTGNNVFEEEGSSESDSCRDIPDPKRLEKSIKLQFRKLW
ncbi:hypothetical protein CCACVL1_13061 [Corchorus capsularis]|uniref:Uncharacterized protein n=1 Tax=Corchorus capsularis TaxID=210143 RepID=A0A1R3ICE0_COCAP|nr:hypothetical protein CCACVL1_13061 [Corchorus capsularis]